MHTGKTELKQGRYTKRGKQKKADERRLVKYGQLKEKGKGDAGKGSRITYTKTKDTTLTRATIVTIRLII